MKILTLLVLTFSVITLNSCKKKDPAPTATITANINGTATTFNVHAMAAKGTLSGMTITTIQGTSSSGTNISITLNGAVTAGTTYTAGTNTNTEPLLALTSTSDQFLNDDTSTTNLVSVTITSVSSTAIAGTFKGDLVSTNIGGTPTTKSVTNGKFSVSF